jgi:hypothetical protein
MPLREEICGPSRYIHCQVTAKGKRTLEKALGVAQLPLQRHGSRTRSRSPYVGSIMLAPDLLPVIGIPALLDSGSHQVWLAKDGELIGIEHSDTDSDVEKFMNLYANKLIRVYTYTGRGDDANQQPTLGWIQ